MFEPSASTTEVWIERVTAWRASGERAETFSRREGYAANTLRWWASKLRHELAAMPTSPEVRIARVVRTSKQPTDVTTQGSITLDVVQAGVRISVETGADRATLAMVLEVLGVGGGR
jgi:uncharacterized protein YcbX